MTIKDFLIQAMNGTDLAGQLELNCPEGTLMVDMPEHGRNIDLYFSNDATLRYLIKSFRPSIMELVKSYSFMTKNVPFRIRVFIDGQEKADFNPAGKNHVSFLYFIQQYLKK